VQPLRPLHVSHTLTAPTTGVHGVGVRGVGGCRWCSELKMAGGLKKSMPAMFRTATWLIYGTRWFTASGFERSAQGFDARDMQVAPAHARTPGLV
jgi:hypothetical protein